LGGFLSYLNSDKFLLEYLNNLYVTEKNQKRRSKIISAEINELKSQISESGFFPPSIVNAWEEIEKGHRSGYSIEEQCQYAIAAIKEVNIVISELSEILEKNYNEYKLFKSWLNLSKKEREEIMALINSGLSNQLKRERWVTFILGLITGIIVSSIFCTYLVF